MSYTAKQWSDISSISAKDLNELALGIQEAHESIDVLEKIIPNLQTTDSEILNELKSITSGTSDAFSMLTDIKNSLDNDSNLAEILKQNTNNFLSKNPQELSNIERAQVLKNLGLNKYTLLEKIIINGETLTNNQLNLNIPKIDTQLNGNSNNAISNAAVVNALENIKLPNLDSYLTNYVTTDIFNQELNTKLNLNLTLLRQEDKRLEQLLDIHTHTDMATKTFVQSELSKIPEAISQKITDHDSDKNAHQYIQDLIKNIDLSSYVKNTGNETIAGLKTFSDPIIVSSAQFHNDGNVFRFGKQSNPNYIAVLSRESTSNFFRPGEDGLLDLGTSTHKWKNIYTSSDIYEAGTKLVEKYSLTTHGHSEYLPLIAGEDNPLTGDLYSSGNIILNNTKSLSIKNAKGSVESIIRFNESDEILLGSAGTSYDITSHSTIKPTASSTTTLGTSKLPWSNIYATAIYQNGVKVSDINHTHDYSDIYAPKVHSHDYSDVYAPKTHTHDYATQSNIDTAVQGIKDWLLGTGNADTIDTIKDIADIMEEHKDVLDALGNTYALKTHDHNDTYMLKTNPVGTGTFSFNRKSNTDTGTDSIALGSNVTASKDYSVAIGRNAKAIGLASLALGLNAESSGDYSTAIGGEFSATAKGKGSFAIGSVAIAEGDYSMAIGHIVKASGTYALATGYDTEAVGYASHAEGCTTESAGYYSHSEGEYTLAKGYASHAEGGLDNMSLSLLFKADKGTSNGELKLCTGQDTLATNNLNNLKPGDILQFKDRHDNTEVFQVRFTSGTSVYVKGTIPDNYTTNISVYKNTNKTIAYSNASHAEGYASQALGPASHAEGIHTIAVGSGAHAEGTGTRAQGYSQHVFGEFNIIDTNASISNYNRDTEYVSNWYTDINAKHGKYIEIVGNGTSDTTRSNARTLDWLGNEWLAGNLTVVGSITEGGTQLSAKYAPISHTHDYATSGHNHDSVYLSKKSGGTVTGPVSFTGTVANMQTTPGVYLGFDTNTEAPNANMAIISANTASYIDMGRPSVDYDFRIIKWNMSGNTNAQLVYGGNAYGTITIPQKDGTMALIEDIPNTSGFATTSQLNAKLTGSKVDSNNPNTFIGYNSEENTNSSYQVAFKGNDQAKGLCWSKFANMSTVNLNPSACTYNGFFYTSFNGNDTTSADSNPFWRFHTSNHDYRILTTAYSDIWLQQIATDFRTPYMFVRRRENGTWKPWESIWGPGAYPWRVEADSLGGIVFKYDY